MKSPLLLLALVALAACGQPKKAKMMHGTKPVEVPAVKSYHEVLDDQTGKRVGFVEKVQYDTGRVVYWVLGPERQLKHGFFLPNGSAFRYTYVDGKRSQDERLGADVYSANARRVLGYKSPVRLRAISLEALLAEELAAQKASAGK